MASRGRKVAATIGTAAAGVAGLCVLAAPAGAATTSSATTTSSAAACDKAAWEAKVQGAPAGLGAGSRSGDYVWHDTTGFHLRVTHGGSHDQRVYSGVVSSPAPLRIDPVRLEKGDTLTLSKDHRSFVFVFANHGYIDGVNFHTDCAAALAVSRLHVGSRDLGPSQVYLGHTRAHPAHVPFVVHRRPQT